MRVNIAPTIAQSDEYVDFGSPWQETTRTVAKAVGKSAEAETLISNVEAKFETVRAENPQFAGKTIAVAYAKGGGEFGYYTAQDGRGRFFSQLGFVIPDELNELAGDSFYVDLSAERIDMLDQDLLVFLGLQFVEGGREAIESDPLVSKLNAVQDGRVLYIPAEVDDALQFGTVLSLDYLLDGLVPEIAKVVGDSDTVSTETTPEATPAS